MPLVLGVDSSAAATRVEVRDADTGALVATGEAPHPRSHPPRSEQDPTGWWSALVDAVARTGQRDIAATAVAGQPRTLVVTDPAGAVLRPAKLGDDTEAAGTAAQLVERFGRDTWAHTVGLVPDAASTVAKLAWLVDHEPEVASRIGHVLGAHDWLTYRLTGRVVTDPGEASTTGCFSTSAGRWRPDVLQRVDGSVDEGRWQQRLPAVLPSGGRADWMAAPIHELVGLRGRPLVATGTAAPMAAALGLGIRPGQLQLTIGPTGTVAAVAASPVADPTGRVDGLADATGRFLAVTPTGDAIGTIRMVAHLLGTDEGGLAELAMSRERDHDGVVLVPGARSALRGLRPGVTREQVARAAFDGVVCSLLDGVDRLVAAGASLSAAPIVVAGPGARAAAFRQAVSDLAGRPVVAPRGERHVARGACVLATAALAEVRPEHVLEAWNLGEGPMTDPADVDREAIRAAHRDQSGRRS